MTAAQRAAWDAALSKDRAEVREALSKREGELRFDARSAPSYVREGLERRAAAFRAAIEALG